MAFLKSLPGTHRHLFKASPRLGILWIALKSFIAVKILEFLPGSESGNEHTHNRDQIWAACPSLPGSGLPSAHIALHSLTSLGTGEWWMIHAEIYRLWGCEPPKGHCINKSSVSHLYSSMSNADNRVKSMFSLESQSSHFHIRGDWTGFLIISITSSPCCSFPGWPPRQ